MLVTHRVVRPHVPWRRLRRLSSRESAALLVFCFKTYFVLLKKRLWTKLTGIVTVSLFHNQFVMNHDAQLELISLTTSAAHSRLSRLPDSIYEDIFTFARIQERLTSLPQVCKLWNARNREWSRFDRTEDRWQVDESFFAAQSSDARIAPYRKHWCGRNHLKATDFRCDRFFTSNRTSNMQAYCSNLRRIRVLHVRSLMDVPTLPCFIKCSSLTSLSFGLFAVSETLEQQKQCLDHLPNLIHLLRLEIYITRYTDITADTDTFPVILDLPNSLSTLSLQVVSLPVREVLPIRIIAQSSWKRLQKLALSGDFTFDLNTSDAENLDLLSCNAFIWSPTARSQRIRDGINNRRDGLSKLLSSCSTSLRRLTIRATHSDIDFAAISCCTELREFIWQDEVANSREREFAIWNGIRLMTMSLRKLEYICMNHNVSSDASFIGLIAASKSLQTLHVHIFDNDYEDEAATVQQREAFTKSEMFYAICRVLPSKCKFRFTGNCTPTVEAIEAAGWIYSHLCFETTHPE